MRAAITFKWRTFGKRRWKVRVVQFVCYFGSYNAALAMLARAAYPYREVVGATSSETEVEWEAARVHITGTILLLVALCFNMHITFMEFLQFLMEGACACENFAAPSVLTTSPACRSQGATISPISQISTFLTSRS
jgi:hypothetical protein